MPPWGRPPGALAEGAGNGRRMDGWGPRPRRMHDQDNSDEDDGQGVILDPANYMSRSSPRGQDDFAGDELYFTGYDLNQAREGRSSGNPSYEDIVYGGYGYEEEERAYYEEQRQAAYRAAWEREAALLQSADDKLRKARITGKSSVSLSRDEADALERRKQHQREKDSPAPSTPKKGKGSRSNSVVSLTGDKSRKKASSSRLFGTSSSPSASRTRTPKTSRKSSSEQQSTPSNYPPAFMVAGPDGVPLYPPMGYYPAPDTLRQSPVGSRPGSRSVSASSKRQVTPPYEAAYPPYPPRFYGPPPPSDMRPASSSSTGRTPSDDSLRIPRNRAASSVPYPQDLFSASAGMPAAQGRRNVSGPADISYAKLRRVPPSSPLAARETSTSPAQEWPPRTDSRRSRGSSSSSTDDDGAGVRVEIVPEADGEGYRIDRKPVGDSGNSGARRRKGRK